MQRGERCPYPSCSPSPREVCSATDISHLLEKLQDNPRVARLSMRAPSAPAALPAPPAVGAAVPRWRPTAADDVPEGLVPSQARHMTGFHAVLIPDAPQTRPYSIQHPQLWQTYAKLLLSASQMISTLLDSLDNSRHENP